MILKTLLETIKAKILLIFDGQDKLKQEKAALLQKVAEQAQTIAEKDAKIADLSDQLVKLQTEFNAALQQDKIDDQQVVDSYEGKLKDLQDQLVVAQDAASKSTAAAQEASAQLQANQQDQADSESAAQDLIAFLDQHLSGDTPTEEQAAAPVEVAPAVVTEGES